ncbi:MAG: histidinol dehydrogenase [Acidimicrobiia bacterium]|jgi:phosphoribosyl-ATP pyrophosphohydrolase/phosphoribosyl-AMP cyclohydrolase/histidinol dehydrogenase
MSPLLRRVPPSDVSGFAPGALDGQVTADAVQIVEAVRDGGEEALREHAVRLGDIEPDQQIVIGREDLQEAFASLDGETRGLLERVHGRIESFARAQRDGLSDLNKQVDGGQAGHRWIPVETVGAYAPGGRYPLPSSVLMTVTPARIAGVTSVWLASPHPSHLTLAAAWVAGADGLVAVGGAQAIAALAFGTVSPPCSLIVGPGNKWVTAAKRHLYGEVGIDGLAGPSEILVIADAEASPARVAADLLAQAEHDVDAVPVLVTTSEDLVERVEKELAAQLADLPTEEVARAAIANGACVLVPSLARAVDVSDSLAPEHLALHVDDPRALALQLRSYGSMFIGSSSAEAFADYGAGPNHVLPTGGGARYQAGLSVFTFLKPATWLAVDDPQPLVQDTARLARLEGLEAHARAALARSRTEI